jgi:hypothetical protein
MSKKRIKLVGAGWHKEIIGGDRVNTGDIIEVDILNDSQIRSKTGSVWCYIQKGYEIEILPDADKSEQEDPRKEPAEVESLTKKIKCKIVEFTIKPCPFCGHEADLKISDSGGIQVGCTNEDCGCTLPSWLPFSKDDDSTVFEKIELAIEYWNKRDY